MDTARGGGGRKTVVGLLGALVLAMLLAGAPTRRAQADAGGETATFQADAARSGRVDGVGLAPPVEVAWRARLGGLATYPVVADGAVYVVVVGAERDATLHVLDLATGARRWGPLDLGTQGATVAVPMGASYEDGTVYVLDHGGFVRAHDADDGRLRWKTGEHHLALRYSRAFTAPPVVADGAVYLAARGWVSALDAAGGATRWRLTGTDHSPGPPAVGGGHLLLGEACVSVRAHDPATGQGRWWADDGGSSGRVGGAAYAEGAVLLPCGDHGAVLDATGGDPVRTLDADSAPAFAGGRVHVVRDGRLVAEDVRTGEHVWTSPNGNLTATPLVVDDHVWAIDRDGGLHAYDAEGTWTYAHTLRETLPMAARSLGLGAGDAHLVVPTADGVIAYRTASLPEPPSAPDRVPAPTWAPGDDRPARATAYRSDPTRRGAVEAGIDPARLEPRWTVDLGGPVSYPVVADGGVFVVVSTSHSRAEVHALRQADAVPLWRPMVLDGIEAPQTVLAYADGTLFVVGGDARVRAVDAATGALRWTADAAARFDGYLGAPQVSAPPVAAHGHLYVATAGSGGDVTALDAATGAILWRDGVPSGGSLAADAHGVYLNEHCRQHAWTPDGERRWGEPGHCGGAGGDRRTPAIHDGRVYARDGGPYGNRVLAAADGTQVGTFGTLEPPALDGNRGFLLVGGALRAVDLDSDVVAWTATADAELVTAPLLADQTVFAGAVDGTLHGYDAATGAHVWETDVGAPFRADVAYGAPVVTGLAAGDGVLVAPAGPRLAVYATPQETRPVRDREPPPDTEPEPRARGRERAVPPRGSVTPRDGGHDARAAARRSARPTGG